MALINGRGRTLRPAIFLFGLILAMATAAWWNPVPAAGETGPQMIPATFADVADKASPAVVNISTVKTVKGGGAAPFPFPGMSPDDSFREFFERFFGDQGSPGEHKERSLGSGFILGPEGLIITNNHVVEGADEIMIRMTDEREFQAKILGRDPKTDLALLKIEAKDHLPYLALGDSSRLRVGDWVVAIGNPFGLEHTVTAGILSARERVIGAGPYDDFLQTDASINPGNSGGPLLNLAGEVIGINTAIVAGGTGIGFAIPANMAKGIITQLKEKGRVVRGWLGVMIQKITPELAKSFKLQSEEGALVADVVSGGPADKAGIKRGDVIVFFDNQPIKKWSDLPIMVAQTPVGEEVKVRVVRNGQEKVFEVKIGELKEEQKVASAPVEGNDLGLSVQELTPELAERLGLEKTEGVIVSGIMSGSPAAEAGLRPGDLILEINRTPVKTMEDYQNALKKIGQGEMALFLIRRGSSTMFFTLKAPTG